MSQSYYRPQPVDFTLLELMPEQGMIGGVHWKGRLARDLRKDVIERVEQDGGTADMVPMSFIQSRLRSMAVAGHCKAFNATGSGGTAIWARTPQGSTFLEKKDEVLS